jgi:hypothetical protein
LKRTIKKLAREDLSDLVIDRDTKNVPGMPDIGHTILEKIAKSAVVIADLTIINAATIRRPDERPVSNPNVLFELGYAFGKLGPKAIIGVFNAASGKIEELPFDLRPKRLVTYQLTGDDEKTNARTMLVNALVVAIRECLGDIEEEQIRLNSRIHDVLALVWLFATEIDEWYGIETLQKTIQDVLNQSSQLPDLMIQRGYTGALLNLARNLIHQLQDAARRVVNQENWPAIKQLISGTEFRARFIHDKLGHTPHEAYHEELVRRVAAMPEELESHLKSLANNQPRYRELQTLSHELRLIAFTRLIPQHPRFGDELAEISLDLRRYLLHWAKNSPPPDEATAAVRDIHERLSRLIGRYAPGLTEAGN